MDAMQSSQVFRDRVEAGKRLAERLWAMGLEKPVVLGLARGGMVPAAEIARLLDGELDVLVARKVGAPRQPEFGVGAVAPGGIRYADLATLERLDLSRAEFELLARREEVEVARRLEMYREGRDPVNVEGREVVIVDDGLATGATALVAARYVRSLNPRRCILAVPVCSREARRLVRNEVDEQVCVVEPAEFYAVGQWYQSFPQLTDPEVLNLLAGGPPRS